MDIILYSHDTNEYLTCDSVIDYSDNAIVELADTLFQKADDEVDFVKKAYDLNPLNS